jgi:hypothetical protein
MGFLDIYFKENQFLIMLVAIVLGWWVYKPHVETLEAKNTWAAEEGKRKAAKRKKLKKREKSELKYLKKMGKLKGKIKYGKGGKKSASAKRKEKEKLETNYFKKLKKLKKRAKIIKEKAVKRRGGNNPKKEGMYSTEINIPSDEFIIVNDDDAEPGYIL